MTGSVRFGRTADGGLALVVYAPDGPVIAPLPPQEAIKLAQVLLTAGLAELEKFGRPVLTEGSPTEGEWDLRQLEETTVEQPEPLG